MIPTTAGAVEVQLLTEEDPVIGRSVACIGGTTQTADIDAGYQAFVARPTGVVERLFGHPCYRLDVSGRIDSGSSWQLGVLTAHALHAAGRLAQEGERAGSVLWATGTVRAVDLTVGAVSHVHEKLVRSCEGLLQELQSKVRVLLATPAANASDLAPNLAAALAAQGAELLGVATVQDVWERLALKQPKGSRWQADPLRRDADMGQERPAPRPAEARGDTSVAGSEPPARRGGRRGRVPFMAPDPPRGFVDRHEQVARLKGRLLDGRGGIVALRGAGGFGKSALASHLCHVPDVRAAYGDGILHVELGEHPDNLIARIADLIELLTGERLGLQTIGPLSAALADALGEGRHLLVIDDVWREQDLRPFLQGGPNTTRLVTTRLEHVLPADTFGVQIDAMQGEEAVALLARGMPAQQCDAERPSLRSLAARLGEWPLLLTLVNGFLRDRVVRGRRPLAQAIVDVSRRLDARGLTAFDAGNAAARHQAVDKTLGLSLELLGPSEQVRLRELAAFPEDTDVPVGICARLWRESGGLDEIDTEDLLQKLVGYSLLLELNLDARTFRLHDVVRQYLLETWTRAHEPRPLAGLHETLVSALGDPSDVATFDSEGDRRYAYEHAARHLAAAGRAETLAAILLDPKWMQDKLAATGPQSLISDYRSFGKGHAQDLVGQVLDLSGRILARDRGQLAAQMLARLAPEDAEGLDAFLAAASSRLPCPALVPSRPTFTAPGAELRRFEGHKEGVTGLAVVDPTRFVSCSRDRTLRLWDAGTGQELRLFEGHEGPVLGLERLDRHRVLSGSADKTIRLWDVETGRELRRFIGHEGAVTCLALSDGRVLSGSEDRTLRLWDVDTGQELRRIAVAGAQATATTRDWSKESFGFAGGITALAVAGARALCATDDKNLRLIDLETGQELRRFNDGEGFANPILSLAVLGGSRFLSGCSERGIFRLWDMETGRELKRFEGLRFWAKGIAALDSCRVVVGTGGYAEVEVWDVDTAQRTARLGGHQTHIASVAALDAQHALSGDELGSIHLWDLANKQKLARFKGLDHWVASFAVLDDRRVLTAAWHGALAIWDMATGEEILGLKGGHKRWVGDIAVLDSRRALSGGSSDRTIRLWDLEAGEELRRFEGHEGGIAALAAVDRSRFLSCSHDGTLRLWHTETGEELRRFEGHEGEVFSLAILDGHRVVSASKDRTMRLWDIETGSELHRFDGHDDAVYAVALVGGGRAVSGSGDKTLRLWDLEAGRELRRFWGHEGAVLCLAAVDCRYVVSGSSDKTLRLWDLEAGAEIARFDGDALFTSLAVLPDKRTVLARDALARLHRIDVRLASATSPSCRD